MVVSAVVFVAVLSPVLGAMGSRFGERQWITSSVMWRSSAPGLDLLALVVPNPLHPLFGGLFAPKLSTMPNGFVENVGSIPWVLMGTLVLAMVYAGARLPRYWIAFSAFFALLALGPFIRVAGSLTYIPTPWARASAIERAHQLLRAWNLGYVVVNTDRAGEDLIRFAKEAFDLTFVAGDGSFQLYRTSLP